MRAKTVRDAIYAVKGPGGAVVRSMPDDVKAEFVKKAEQLGRQIATDNNVDFETSHVSDDAELSETATSLLAELESIKNQLLRLSFR